VVDEQEASTMKQVAVVLETTSSGSSEEEEKPRHHARTSSSTRVAASTRSEPNVGSGKSKPRRDSSRRRSRSRHERGSQTADGVVVHVTKEAKALDEEPGNLMMGWEVEHVQGVRYEVRTPKDDQTDERLEVHLQKPCLAYHR